MSFGLIFVAVDGHPRVGFAIRIRKMDTELTISARTYMIPETIHRFKMKSVHLWRFGMIAFFSSESTGYHAGIAFRNEAFRRRSVNESCLSKSPDVNRQFVDDHPRADRFRSFTDDLSFENDADEIARGGHVGDLGRT